MIKDFLERINYNLGEYSAKLVYVVLIYVILPPVIFNSIKYWIIEIQVENDGILSQGNIVKRDTSSVDDTTFHYLTFEYQIVEADGAKRTYQYTQQVSSASYDRHPNGMNVTITYLLSEPENAQLSGHDYDPRDVFASVSFILVWLIFALLPLLPIVRPSVKLNFT